MKNFKFTLNNVVVSFFDARNYMIQIYKNRGFSETEAKYFFAECLRDDSIGKLKRLQLNQHNIFVSEVALGE
jgi:hypothetical protein